MPEKVITEQNPSSVQRMVRTISVSRFQSSPAFRAGIPLDTTHSRNCWSPRRTPQEMRVHCAKEFAKDLGATARHLRSWFLWWRVCVREQGIAAFARLWAALLAPVARLRIRRSSYCPNVPDELPPPSNLGRRDRRRALENPEAGGG